MNLSNTQLFRGLEEAEITSLLDCLNATTRSFQKGEVILSEGNITENIGILLSGLAVISCNDIWGNPCTEKRIMAGGPTTTATVFCTLSSLI